MKGTYIVVTDTNEWVATLTDTSEYDLPSAIDEIKTWYDGSAVEFYAYKTDNQVKTFKR